MHVVSNYTYIQELFAMWQTYNETITDYYNRFRDKFEVTKAYEGSTVNDGMKDCAAYNEDSKDYIGLTSSEQPALDPKLEIVGKSTLCLMWPDNNVVFVRNELNNNFISENDNYPSDTTATIVYILNYKR